MRSEPGEIPGLREVGEEVVYPHIFPNADREVGGVLIGRTVEDGPLPLITGAIPALSADEQLATLTFTQDTWEHVHRRLESDFPETDQIVGWYHSHPNFGVFLSEHDLFIHRNFFHGESQIALVVDPHRQTEGVFVWRDGDIEKLCEMPTPPEWTVKSSSSASVAPAAGAAPADPAVRSHQGEGQLVMPAKPRGFLRRIADGHGPWALAGLIAAGVVVALAAASLATGGGDGPKPKPKPATHHHRGRSVPGATRSDSSDCLYTSTIPCSDTPTLQSTRSPSGSSGGGGRVLPGGVVGPLCTKQQIRAGKCRKRTASATARDQGGNGNGAAVPRG